MYVIMEGPDNTGKDTQIKKLLTYFALRGKETHVLHYSNIPGVHSKDSRLMSEKMYHDMFRMLHLMYSRSSRNMILNRSHIGESVYSPIYRGYDGDYVFNIEDEWRKHEFFNDIHLVTMIDDPKNLIERDDGLSFSTDLKTRAHENHMFLRAHQISLVKHKRFINISNRSIDDVHETIVEFIEGRF